MALPSGYTQLEYIESSGTQYIDTGVVGKSTINADFKAQMTGSVGSKQVLCEAYHSGSATLLCFWRNGAGTFQVSRGGSYVGLLTADQKIHEIKVRQTYVEVDGTQYSASGTASTTATLPLFAETYAGSPQAYGSFKLYYAKFYDGEILIRDFIPVIRTSDSVVGLYDLENDVFYTNAGSGSFTAGPTIDPTAPKGKHNTLIDGVSYPIKCGKVLIDGVAYTINRGRTLIDGTGYNIVLSAQKVTITLQYGYNADLTLATINGSTYGGSSGSPHTETVDVEVGTEVTFYTKKYTEVYGSSSNIFTSGKITVDGTTVASGSKSLSYTMIINSDITVNMDRTSSQGTVYPTIAITTS